MKIGRPTKYDDSICEEVYQYCNVIPFHEENGKRIPNTLPTKAGLAVLLGVNRDTIKEWVKIHPKFSAAIKALEAAQEHILHTNALLGLYSPAYSIFVAKNFTEMTDDYGAVMNINIVDRYLRENN